MHFFSLGTPFWFFIIIILIIIIVIIIIVIIIIVIIIIFIIIIFIIMCQVPNMTFYTMGGVKGWDLQSVVIQVLRPGLYICDTSQITFINNFTTMIK